MAIAVKIFVLAALIRLLLATDKPLVCAVIYALVAFGLGLAFYDLDAAAMSGGISLVAATAYFWLLDKFDEGALLWWVVAILGVPIVLI